MPACSTLGSAAGYSYDSERVEATSTRRLLAVGVVGHDDGRAELLVRAHVALEPRGQVLGEGDAVALDGDVDVEARLAEQQVADGAADEVHAAHAGGHGLDLAQQRRPGRARRGGPARLATTGAGGSGAPRVAGHGAPRDRAEHVVDGAVSRGRASRATGAQPISSWAMLAAARSSGVSRRRRP